MKAIVIDQYDPVEGLVYKEVPKPEELEGHVNIKQSYLVYSGLTEFMRHIV